MLGDEIVLRRRSASDGASAALCRGVTGL